MQSEILDQIRRRILKNFMDTVILMELRKHPMSGYDVTLFVRNRFHLLLSPSNVYFSLHFLERNGLVKGECSRRKTVYTLTERGKENVKAFINAKDEILGLVLNLFISE